MVGVQVNQTKDPRFKTMVAEKLPPLSSFKGQSSEYQGFPGTWWLKVSPHNDPVTYRQLNYIHKVVH